MNAVCLVYLFTVVTIPESIMALGNIHWIKIESGITLKTGESIKIGIYWGFFYINEILLF